MATDKEGYIKKSTTYEEQIEILKARNLYIENEEFALSVLKRINYYRLSAYMLTFKTKQGNYAGATFNTIYELYRFDKELRNLLLPLLEDIEIAIRAQISYLHALSNLRNKCAHYGRLYNRKLTVTPKLFKATKRKGINSDTLFGDVYVIGRLSKKTDEWGKFIANLRNLIQHYEVVELGALGFPIDWEKY